MTGIWPREPRRFWHVGPMARSVRDLKLALSILTGPDGKDSLSSRVPVLETAPPQKQLRVGWLVRPGFGPIQPQVGDTVEAGARALEKAGCIVQQVTIPALERDPPLDVFLKLHVNEMKPVFEQTTRGQPDDHIGPIARFMLDTPETSIEDFVQAEQAAQRLSDAFAEFFQGYDALLCPVLPLPAHEHRLTSVKVEGEDIDGIKIMAATVPFNVTGLPAISLPFGLSDEGLPIGVQIVGAWNDEATILDLAAKLENQSPIQGMRPKV